jgi:prepilin-type processing-associated H-X9-DG protein
MSATPAFPRNTWLLLLLAVACFAGCAPLGHSHEKSPQIQSLSNLKQLGRGMSMYLQDYDEKFPPLKDFSRLKELLDPYLKKDLWEIPHYKINYAANITLDQKLYEKLESPASTVFLYEPAALWGNRNFRNVCFADGHVKAVSETNWVILKRRSGVPDLPEPKVAPWWRFDVKGLREPVRQNHLATVLSSLGLVFCGLAAFLRLRYAPATFLKGVGEVIGYGLGYLVLTSILGFVIGLIFLF